MDDFGAGYSSLVRLKQLPFSELKIDRTFVANCHQDPVNGGLCETIVELARRCGLKSVAEGIETNHESPSCIRWVARSGRDTCSPSRCRRPN